MIKSIQLSLAILLFLALIGACKHDPVQPEKKQVVTPVDTTRQDTSGCDTVNVKFSMQVKKVMQDNCYRCHGSAVYTTKGSGYNLEDYAGLKTMADNGKLVKAIEHTAGTIPMPLDQSAKIDDCSISKIKIWVADGAPNN